MNKNLKSNNDKFAKGNSIVSRFFSVITGFILVILVQQWINLVNKIALLLHKYRFSQDCRNRLCVMSGNDGCWGCRLSVCCKFLNRMYHPGSSANELTLKAKDDYKSTLQGGRSMIEMLGVLAIIAVLSVGGIAGYSQALEKWKINKTLEGYSYLTQGLMEHIDNLKVLQPTNDAGKHYLLETIKGLNLIPEGWSIQNISLVDTTGSMVTVFARRNHLVYDIALGTYSFDDSNNIRSDNFSAKLCREFISNFAQPLHSSLQYIWIFKTQTEAEYYMGDSLCNNNNKCLINMTLSDIQNACTSCVIGTDFCLLVLEF